MVLVSEMAPNYNFLRTLFAGKKEIRVHTPPGSEYFDLAEYYAFRLFLLIVFVVWLYRTVRKEIKGSDH